MWWEAIPSCAVIVVCMGLYPMVSYAVNRIQFGIPYKRQILYVGEAQLYLRDERVSGKNNAYVQKGLESIPDREERPAADCKCD